MAFRIVSLNIRHGGGKRIARLADWLATKSPTAVVLPEWRNNLSGQYIRERLADYGFQSVAAAGGKTKINSILLAAIGVTDFQKCIQVAKRRPEVPFVMIGDINTGRNDLDIEGTGARFHCTDLFEALTTEAGLTDLWRAQHGDRQEWTWRSSVNGFRIDHVFGNKAFIDRFPAFRCAIDHAPRLSGLTDHSAVVLEAD